MFPGEISKANTDAGENESFRKLHIGSLPFTLILHLLVFLVTIWIDIVLAFLYFELQVEESFQMSQQVYGLLSPST